MNRLIPYYRARYYSPSIGRFLSRDPLANSDILMSQDIYEYLHIQDQWVKKDLKADINALAIFALELYGSSTAISVNNRRLIIYSALVLLRGAHINSTATEDLFKKANSIYLVNLYDYMLSNPINGVDPSGLCPCHYDPSNGATGAIYGLAAGATVGFFAGEVVGSAIGAVGGSVVGYAYGSDYLECLWGPTFDPAHPGNLLKGLKDILDAYDPIPKWVYKLG